MPASPAQDRLIDSVADGSTRPHRRGDGGRERTLADLGPHYKWIALSNTTLGMLLATINSSIVLIALPDIFKGININPLEAGNTSYLLWMMMGFMVVTAVLVVSFGRLGDMYGRARMYNLGFAVFTISSILLAVTWMDGSMAAWWLIGWRIIQGIGGAFLIANSSAILTAGYEPASRILEIEYVGGEPAYRYFDVPPAVWDAFRGAKSKGRFVNEHVRDAFRSERVRW